MTPFKLIAGGVIAFFTLIIAITVLFGSWYTIDQGERGVLLRNGAIIGTAQPGLGFKTPWIEDVVEISVQTHVATFEQMATYSKDQQPAELKLSVNYHILPDAVEDVYARFGDADGLVQRIVYPKVFEETKNVFGRFSAVKAIQERAQLNLEIAQAIQTAVKGPILIDSVQIENIDFSDSYEQSIEQRMLAEVEVQKLRQNADREKVQAEIVVTQAKAKAEGVLAAASAEAEAIKLRGNAEAEVINSRGKALKDNPMLIELVQAEKWNGTLPTTMVPGGTVPFVNIR